jgi:hypothetical protein
MPPLPKYNWSYLYDVYQKLLETVPDTSSSDFARQNGVSEEACRKAFKRIENKHKKWRTIRTKNGRTNGQTNPGLFDDVSPEEATEIVKQVSNSRLVAVHAKVLAILCSNLNQLEDIQAKVRARDADGNFIIKIETQLDAKTSVQVVNEITRGLQEIMPFIVELQERAGLDKIISKLQNREYDVTQAAIEISRIGSSLPEALRIMLSKTPPVMIANNFEVTNLDELDQRALEALKQVQWQHECFLPQRRDEVTELKKELQCIESFAPGTEGK